MKGNSMQGRTGMPERVRVENIMNQFRAGEYGDPNSGNLRVFPLICKAYDLLERDSKILLTELRNRSWVSLGELQPDIGDEVLVRFDDQAGAHVELMEWNQEEAEFFDDECDSKEVFWMRLPPL